ncbi:MAG: hypothetical protein KDA22_07810 [Phycisphaerales bacterium]|nr:hypothetical protein [Phycisphaerales bacterium]
MRRFLTAALVGSLATVITTGIIGCESDPNPVSFNNIKSDLTPELMTMSERPSDVDRNMAVVGNINIRNMWNDLGRMWMFDRPSILSPYPVYGPSGIPK